MRCEQSLENLTSLLQHELSQADTDALQRHLAVCDGCRKEYRDLSTVQDALRKNTPVEPSATSRDELQDQIDGIIAGRRKNSSTANRSDEQSPQWKLVTPAPQAALDYQPPKALPPAPSSEAAPIVPVKPLPLRGKSDLPARTASGRLRTVSTRLPAPVEDNRWASAVIWIVISVIVIATIAVMAITDRPPAQQPDAYRPQRLASGRRLDERSAAKVRGRLSDTLVNTQVQLGNSAAAGTLRIVPHRDPRTGESCIVAYREEDIEKLRGDTRVDQTALEALLSSATEVSVADGRCTLPREFVEQHLNSDPKVSVLDLDNRIEIWSSAAFESYLTGGGKFDPAAPAAKNGLPVLK
jgi:hypothetical protein